MSFSLEPIRHLYDFQSHYLDLNGFRCHYLDEGQGEALVLLHGNPSWSFMYRELIRSLRKRYRVIVPDHIGCGLSEKPNDKAYSYRLARRIDDLEQLLQRLQVGSGLTLVMHDWGGPIGMGYASRHASDIARLVVFNTAAFPVPSGKLHWCLRMCRSSLTGVLAIRGLNLLVRATLRLGSRKSMPSDVRAGYLGPYDSWHNRIALLRFVQDIPLGPADPSFEILKRTGESLFQFRKLPVLICWGERDFVFDAEFLRLWLRYFPAAEVHRFSDGGHCLLEDAVQAIAPLVENFLVRHPRGGKNE